MRTPKRHHPANLLQHYLSEGITQHELPLPRRMMELPRPSRTGSGEAVIGLNRASFSTRLQCIWASPVNDVTKPSAELRVRLVYSWSSLLSSLVVCAALTLAINLENLRVKRHSSYSLTMILRTTHLAAAAAAITHSAPGVHCASCCPVFSDITHSLWNLPPQPWHMQCKLASQALGSF